MTLERKARKRFWCDMTHMTHHTEEVHLAQPHAMQLCPRCPASSLQWKHPPPQEDGLSEVLPMLSSSYNHFDNFFISEVPKGIIEAMHFCRWPHSWMCRLRLTSENYSIPHPQAVFGETLKCSHGLGIHEKRSPCKARIAKISDDFGSRWVNALAIRNPFWGPIYFNLG